MSLTEQCHHVVRYMARRSHKYAQGADGGIRYLLPLIKVTGYIQVTCVDIVHLLKQGGVAHSLSHHLHPASVDMMVHLNFMETVHV